MDIKDKLEQAVETRADKRNRAYKPPYNETLAKLLNDFLEDNLAKAIAMDKPNLVLTLKYTDILDDIWDILGQYEPFVDSTKNLLSDYVAEVYKPYLLGAMVSRHYYSYSRITERGEVTIYFYIR